MKENAITPHFNLDRAEAIVMLFATGWTITRLAPLFGDTESFIEAVIRHRMNKQ